MHCGFCNATCPTYELTGNELDGPRGRIYLIKNFFEENPEEKHEKNREDSGNETSLKHLDRCLTCLACETTCPSGVKYGELVDIGRKHINASIQRPALSKLKRKLILTAFSNSKRVGILLAIARIFKPLLPAINLTSLASKIPAKIKLPPDALSSTELPSTISRKMFTIKGCVQNAAAPQINFATKKVLENSAIQLDEVNSSCCSALAFHLTELEQAHTTIRKNIDDWYQMLNDGYEKIVINSSGCSTFVKQYETIMQDDSAYADKAKFISEHCIDLSELASELKPRASSATKKTIAFHSPCTLQHGQQINGKIEEKLTQAGYDLVEVQDSHLCCGSAGTYSLLETEMSSELLKNKLSNLKKHQPDMIVTANIGCLMHLQSGTDIPVKHWIELLA